MEALHPLAAYRKTAGISRAELARRLKVSRAAVCRWENGTRHPDKSLWAAILEETGLRPSEVGGFTLLEAAPRRRKRMPRNEARAAA